MGVCSILWLVPVTERCVGCRGSKSGDDPNVLPGRAGSYFETRAVAEKVRNRILRLVKHVYPTRSKNGIELLELEDAGSEAWVIRFYACLGHVSILRVIRMKIEECIGPLVSIP